MPSGGARPGPGSLPINTSNIPDWLKALLPATIGAYAGSQQADAYKDIAREYMGMGAPYRDSLAALSADPSSFLKSDRVQVPVKLGTEIMSKSLGNAAAQGGALQQLQDYATQTMYGQLTNRENQLANFGGLSSFNAAAPAANTAGINAGSNAWNAIGSGVSNYLNPPQKAPTGWDATTGKFTYS